MPGLFGWRGRNGFVRLISIPLFKMNERNHYRSWAEIDLDALAFNLRRVRSLRKGAKPVIPVVKADAYGHGLHAVTARLWREGIRIVAVANIQEAMGVSRAAPGMNVLLLSPLLPEEIEELPHHPRWLATLSSPSELKRLEQAAARQCRKITVHLELDTGMGRTGAFPKELLALLQRLQTSQHVKVGGLYSHLAAADTSRDESVRQLARFRQFGDRLRQSGYSLPPQHFENSAGSIVLPASSSRAPGSPRGVRFGLALYGVPMPRSAWSRRFGPCPLKPVLTWKTRIGLLREMPAGTTISYGCTFRARRRMWIAVLCAGYADGISRKLSNRGAVLIRGQRCRILGRVTMDMVVVDVSRVAQVCWGDDAVLIGGDGAGKIPAAEFAEWAETIPYEVFCGISKRVPRIALPRR